LLAKRGSITIDKSDTVSSKTLLSGIKEQFKELSESLSVWIL